jgi:hypothetical protein
MYPVVGIIAHPLPNDMVAFYVLQPATLKAKVDIKPGQAIHSGGLEINVTRSVKAGDSIPAIFDGYGRVLSAEADEGLKSESKPWFTAFKEGTDPDDRADAIRAWRIEKNRTRQ